MIFKMIREERKSMHSLSTRRGILATMLRRTLLYGNLSADFRWLSLRSLYSASIKVFITPQHFRLLLAQGGLTLRDLINCTFSVVLASGSRLKSSSMAALN